MKSTTLIALVLLVLLGCFGSTLAGASDEEPPPFTDSERLCGASIWPETFYVDVMSNGCTEAGDFVFVTERAGQSEADLLIVRIRPDYCRGMVRRVTLEFNRKVLGLDGYDTINLQNPLSGYCPARW